MAFDSKFIDRFKRIVLPRVSSFEIAALSSVQGMMLQRIHNDGKASDNSLLGDYSAQYAKFRKLHGRQTGKKDLELFGGLRRSVKLGVSGKNNVLGFDNDNARLIAGYQEGQVKKKIYTLSDQEDKERVEAYTRELNFHLRKVRR